MTPLPVKLYCPNCGAAALNIELEWSDEIGEYICPVCKETHEEDEEDPTTFEDEYPDLPEPNGDIGC